MTQKNSKKPSTRISGLCYTDSSQHAPTGSVRSIPVRPLSGCAPHSPGGIPKKFRSGSVSAPVCPSLQTAFCVCSTACPGCFSQSPMQHPPVPQTAFRCAASPVPPHCGRVRVPPHPDGAPHRRGVPPRPVLPSAKAAPEPPGFPEKIPANAPPCIFIVSPPRSRLKASETAYFRRKTSVSPQNLASPEKRSYPWHTEK